MEPTQEQIIQDQITERARHAAMVASASGKLAGNTLMSTVKGAETIGEKAVIFGALAGVASFFMPWVSLFGMSGSGSRAADQVSTLFLLHPISLIVCFILALTTRSDGAKELILTARWYILVGTVWFTPGIAAVTNLPSDAVGIGCYLATLSAGAILVGGFLQVGERLQDLGSANETVAVEPQ